MVPRDIVASPSSDGKAGGVQDAAGQPVWGCHEEFVLIYLELKDLFQLVQVSSFFSQLPYS